MRRVILARRPASVRCAPYTLADIPPRRSGRASRQSTFERSFVILLSHEPAGPLERALLAGPAEVRKETLAVDGLENLFDPAREPPVVTSFFVEVDLLKARFLRLY